MATYKYMTKDGQKVQVESAKRDGSGKNIENNYAKQTGYYSGMGVGSADLADNLTTTTGITDTTSFVFQSSGGQQDIATGYAELRALRGNSVAFNQMVQNGNFESTSGWNIPNISTMSVSNNTLRLTANSSGTLYINQFLSNDIVKNHKYLLTFYAKLSKNGNVGYRFFIGNSSTSYVGMSYDTNKQLITAIIQSDLETDTSQLRLYAYFGNTAVSGDFVDFNDVQLFDLTLMFGAGNEPTSVVEFNRLFPKPYYEYNAGTLLSSQTSAYKIVGYNALSLNRTVGTFPSGGGNTAQRAFDETKYYAGLNANNYYNIEKNTDVSVANGSVSFQTSAFGYGVALPIKVIAGQSYTISFDATISSDYRIGWYDQGGNIISYDTSSSATKVAPNNAYWGVLILTPNTLNTMVTYTNICLHLTWSGSKTGYEPYYSFTYTMPNVELRSAGSVYDELKPDGTLIRRVGVVDLGSFPESAWYYDSPATRFILSSLSPLAKTMTNNQTIPNAICSKYKCVSIHDFDNNLPNMSLRFHSSSGAYIMVRNTAYTNLSDFVSSLNGVYLIYELATPTTEQNDAYKYDELGRIDDYGTQEFISEQTIQVPQGAEFFYQKNLKDFLNRIGSRADIDFVPSNVVSQSELGASETQRDTIDAQLKENIGGLLRQCLCVKESLDFNNTAWVDLGTLNWSRQQSSNGVYYFYANISDIVVPSGAGNTSILSTKYGTLAGINVGVSTTSNFTNKTICRSVGGTSINVRDDSYTDATAFKNAMKGVLLAYEKA